MGVKPPDKDAPPSPDNYWRHINYCGLCHSLFGGGPGCAEGRRLAGMEPEPAIDMDPHGPGLPTRIPG